MTDFPAAPILPIPVVVDYTNRDFYSLREKLIERVKARVNSGGRNSWYGNDPADFGLALIEAFAYMGDITSYYIDRVANENTLLTASQRESILNLAYSYGYTPSGYKQASCDVTFSADQVGVASVPAGTQLRATVTSNDVVQQLIFTTSSAADFSTSTSTISGAAGSSGSVVYTTTAAHNLQVGYRVNVTGITPTGYNVSNALITAVTTTSPYTFTILSSATGTYTSGGSVTGAPASRSVKATHGYNVSTLYSVGSDSTDIPGEQLGVSDGTPNQLFQLKESQVVDNSIVIYVVSGPTNGKTYGKWTEVIHLSDYTPTDAVFKVVKGSNNSIYVQFGDGVSGAIPNTNAVIKAQYIYGGGNVGNVLANAINTVKTPVANIVVANTAPATGGADPEGIDAIRVNAPQAFTALNRAVSLTDYEGLSLQVSGVGKANAVADVWSSVTLYIAPTSTDPTDLYPGKNTSNSAVTSQWTTLKDTVLDALSPKQLIGTTLTVSAPTYSPVVLKVEYSKQPQVTDAQIVLAIKNYINTYYSYNSTPFAQIIHPEEIEFLLRYAPGIQNVWVTELRRSTESSGLLSTLVGSASEIFVFNSDNVTATARSTDATLLSLTPSVGSLSPSFAAGTLNYLLDIGSGTATTISAVVNASGAKVTVNGSANSASITNNSVGSTVNVPVIVTAPDSRTLQTYTVAVYKSS
jgi:hypothetical protein